MKRKSWGEQGLEASIQGLGAMGMSAFYGGRDDVESAATLNRALDLGVSMIDTAELYGPFTNEKLIGASIGHRREEFAIASKFALEFNDQGEPLGVNCSPRNVRIAIERSLRHLGMETIDLYYVHRIDPNVPIEETVGAMAEFVAEGKVRFLGLSEAAPVTIQRAHATHPLTAVQTEYSLFERSPEVNGVLETTRTLGIEFVAYSPLGRGLLTGAITHVGELAEEDSRREMPRFAADSMAKNADVVQKVAALAEAKGVTPAQLALAWLAHQEKVVSIPGTKRRSYLEENVAAAQIDLTAEEMIALSNAAPVGITVGERYGEMGMRQVHL